MNSDDLEYFVRVARCGSISRAAMELGTDQSTVSRYMARLEADSKVRLFHRSGRGVILTDAGRTLLDHAQKVSTALDQARDAVRSFTEQGPSQLVIAAQPTIARSVFASVGKALKARFPNTRLRFVEGLGAHMLTWLADGDIDVAIFYLPAHSGGLKVDILLTERVRLIAPASRSHIGSEFPVRRLAELPLVLPSTPHGVRLLAESLAARAGIRLDIALECDASTSVTKRLVQEGCGCTILPLAAVAEEGAQGRLHAAHLVEPEVTREVGLAVSRNRPQAPELWGVMQCIRQEVRQIVASGLWPDAGLHD